MAEDQISAHEIRIYEAVRTKGGWMTAREIAAAADVAYRTARHHVKALSVRSLRGREGVRRLPLSHQVRPGAPGAGVRGSARGRQADLWIGGKAQQACRVRGT